MEWVDDLLSAIVSRLHQDLHGPRDGGRDGWDLCCKALLWFMFSEGVLSYPSSHRTEELYRYLFTRVVETARRFSLNEDLVVLGLFALKRAAERRA